MRVALRIDTKIWRWNLPEPYGPRQYLQLLLTITRRVHETLGPRIVQTDPLAGANTPPSPRTDT